jgi:DGQHR domain-containing protein
VARRKDYDTVTVAQTEIAGSISQGWEIDKELKKCTRLKKQKEIDERLENRFWMLLFRMGYPEMNRGRNFQIRIERKGAEVLEKQIDVFAKDDETVIVAECKASARLAKRSLQKDLEEFGNLKGPIAAAIQSHYAHEFKPKIIWLFVTENIIWSKPDKERASGLQIRVITERELRYYAQIAELLGKAARYQFLAEFLKDQPIPELRNNKLPAIRGKLGGHKFYSFITTPRQLLKIAFINHRSLNDPEGAPTYQRLISRPRLRDIGKFIVGGGYFPTNILVNFARPVRFDKIVHDDTSDVTYGELYLPDKYRSAWIIDGQHRLYGFSPIDDKYLDQNIIVIAFEQLQKAEEAGLFVTINHEQKSVPKHLLDDLEGELKWGSNIPTERIGAIAARLINILNADVGEPFYNRVTQQGIPSTDKTCLTIPAIKDGIRRSGLVGRAVADKSTYELGPLCGGTDSQTLEKARCALNQYFSLMRDSNYNQWDAGRSGYLCTNVAVQGYLLLFASLIKYMEANKAMDARELTDEEILVEVEEYIEPVLKFNKEATIAELEETLKVQFGSGGPREYYYRLCRLVKNSYADFEPEGMEGWEAEQSEEKISSADKKIKDINIIVQSYIFKTFRNQYGDQKDIYWDKGVSDKGIKSKAYERSLDDEVEVRLPLENYLDFIDYKKVVENKQHWPLFKGVFDIPEPGEKGYSKNLRWMERINELRRIPAHATEKRHYKTEDFEYIDYVYDELHKRLKEAEDNPPTQPAGEGAPGDA